MATMLRMHAQAQLWTTRALAYGTVGALLTFLIVAIPTAVVANPFFIRMTPVRPLDVVFLVVTVLLAGVLAATYARPSGQGSAGTGVFGGWLGVLAIGCPVCNKLVVLALGTAGALTYFEPVQPLLGAAGVVLLGWAVRARLRALEGCPLPAPPPPRAMRGA